MQIVTYVSSVLRVSGARRGFSEERNSIETSPSKDTTKKSQLKLGRRSAGASISGIMAALKVFIFIVYLSLILTHIRVDADADKTIFGVDDDVQVPRSDGSESVLIEQLKSKIQTLG